MAIDTPAKRISMLAFASPLAWQYHFEVDGSIDADDRAHLLHLYGGIPFDAPVEPQPQPVTSTVKFRLGRGATIKLLGRGRLNQPVGTGRFN